MRMVPVAFALYVLLRSSTANAEDDPNKAPSRGTAGLLMFGGSYGASVGAATAAYRNKDDEIAMKMFIPILGSWLMLGDDRFDHDTTFTARLAEGIDCDSYCPGVLLLIPVAIVEYGWLVIDPIAQATGLVMAMIEAGKTPPRSPPSMEAVTAKPRVKVKATFVGRAPGVALSITEW